MGEDRLSILPEDILYRILSFADTKTAVRTSVLATSWRDLWKSVSVMKLKLYFDEEVFHTRSMNNFMDRVFTNREYATQIRKLDLAVELDTTHQDKLSGWIRGALSYNLEELSLIAYGEALELPSDYLFASRSLRVLKLDIRDDAYMFEYPRSRVSLPNLKKLEFKPSFIVDGDFLPLLFNGCPLLESLIIEQSEVNLEGDLSLSAPNLKHCALKIFMEWEPFSGVQELIDFSRKIILNAPKLEVFKCKSSPLTEFAFENLTSLREAVLRISKVHLTKESEDTIKFCLQRFTGLLSGLSSVTDLALSGSMLQVISKLPPLQFFNLNYLELTTWLSSDSIQAILHLLDISPNIGTLSLKIEKRRTNVPLRWDEVNLPLKVLHHLKNIKMKTVMGSSDELKLLETLLQSGVAVEKVAISSFDWESTSSLKIFKEKIFTFSKAKILFYKLYLRKS